MLRWNNTLWLVKSAHLTRSFISGKHICALLNFMRLGPGFLLPMLYFDAKSAGLASSAVVQTCHTFLKIYQLQLLKRASMHLPAFACICHNFENVKTISHLNLQMSTWLSLKGFLIISFNDLQAYKEWIFNRQFAIFPFIVQHETYLS